VDNGSSTTDLLNTASFTNVNGGGTVSSDKLTTLNVTTSATTNDTSITVGNTTAGHALAVNLNGNGDSTGGWEVAIPDAAATSLVINSPGASSRIDLSAALATSVKFTGDKAVSTVNAHTLAANAVLDATVTTGGVSIGKALATGQQFLGGSGNDTITTSGAFTVANSLGGGTDSATVTGATLAAAFGVGGSLDGGAGTDTLQGDVAFFANASLNSTNGTTFAAAAKGFETARFNVAGAVTVDASILNTGAANSFHTFRASKDVGGSTFNAL